MKSLILKDVYNIGHNSRSMLLILILFMVLLLPVNGPISYIIMSCIMCSMMVVTTFAFDENAKWTNYAIIMPISKKQIVMSKFIVLLIFTTIGAGFGLVFGAIGGILFKKFDYMSLSGWLTLISAAGIGMVIAFFFGSIVIPLLYKFGAEKARILSIVAFALPVMVSLGLYQIMVTFGITFSNTAIVIGLVLSPFITVFWSIVMFKISCKTFNQQEFN
ncbi:ABC-2 transporter permease [Fusibacter sp. 3D3]|uniref:ABC-2 transporter permease n=1 Tax=Fusibacter sp. 3D3 TaxID=1048380 RepID=UPI000853E725|nr:ABC-2 transporter permease [Fusibacter sp. 3D3]GAU78292.1 ABC transporter permease protein [Fusibacter sp. 3D3]